ncbi:prephenate dehydrogenase/arogenate dehydrogenase family protein [candidate division GN15 bacterium]|nr:prephenate dehydrogenase/arogenate dehydrogenase family protein [candidate division GN15 bacterium]
MVPKLEERSQRELTVGVLGLGQMGGSICAAISRKCLNWQVVAYDPDRKLVNTAVDRSICQSTHKSEAEVIAAADIVILAVHHQIAVKLLRIHAEQLRRSQLVLDVGTVKLEICGEAEQLGLTNFIGGHPLAGSEKTAPEAWRYDLFENARIFIATSMNTTDVSRRLMLELIASLGALPTEIDPQQHDEVVGLTIGLPHLVAFALQTLAERQQDAGDLVKMLAGPSFASATRVAHSDKQMARQILWSNRRSIVPQLERLQQLLGEVKDGLAREDEASLRQLIDTTGAL